MEGPHRLRDLTYQRNLYAGEKGFSGQPASKLTILLLKYRSLAGDVSTPPALRDYSATTAGEIREELNSRALQEGRAA